jgi:D-glycero-alpha-D-manno-heptose-7-phosphate kinase
MDKYAYITLHKSFFAEYILKYSRMERTDSIQAIEHPLIREALLLCGRDSGYLEITSMSDIPAGTGLGSSGSFLTGLLHALHVDRKLVVPKQELAEQACRIEIEILGEPVGKQDQYIAAFGGITAFEFDVDGSVRVEPLKIGEETLANLEENLILVFTGITRSASEILQDQHSRSLSGDKAMVDNLHFVKQLGFESREALESGDLRRFAAIMHTHWEYKKQRSSGMSTTKIDAWYETARVNGALGGKIIGAGGGGFLMFYTEEKTRLRRALRSLGLREIKMRFDYQGTTLVTQS